MRNRTARARAALLALAACLAAQQAALPQSKPRPGQSEADQMSRRLEKLLEVRSREHWKELETQLIPTPPPGAQPVRALAEWHPSGGVLLTLPEGYRNSFSLNEVLKTEARGAELARRDPAFVRYVKVMSCAALYSARNSSPEKIRKNPLVMPALDAVCDDVPPAERRPLAQNWGTAEVAEGWLNYLYTNLSDDKLLDELTPAHAFIQMAKNFAQHTKVVILLQEAGLAGDALNDWVETLRGFTAAAELLGSKNVQFVQLKVRTQWVRDYGPIFVRGADGQIVCLDPRYNTDRVSIEEKEEAARLKSVFREFMKELPAGKSKSQEDDRLLDDVSPSFLAARLRQRRGRSLSSGPVSIARPPIALDGGDYFTDGNGVGFTSTRTLQLNGSDLESLNQVFRQYFGLTDVVYLRPLPGRTVPHIDMFFKVVSPEIILLGWFGPAPGAGSAALMQTEAQRSMDYNLKVLRDFYERRRAKVNVVSSEADKFRPGAVNIVLVPMPDLRRPDRERLAAVEQSLARWEEEYERKAHAFRQAYALYLGLAAPVKSLKETHSELASFAAKFEGPRASKSVDLARLREVLAKLIPSVRDLYEKHGAGTKSIDWLGSYQQLVDFSAYLDRLKAQDGRKLKDNDRRLLAFYLRQPVSALQALASGLEASRAEVKRGYEQQEAEAGRVREKMGQLSEQKKTLEQRLPYSLDLYRTFLNALQVRTGRSNLLFVPSYSNLDALERRAQNILRLVYTRAYGAVTIVPVNSDYFIREAGSIHCLAQSLPAEVDVFSDR